MEENILSAEQNILDSFRDRMGIKGEEYIVDMLIARVAITNRKWDDEISPIEAEAERCGVCPLAVPPINCSGSKNAERFERYCGKKDLMGCYMDCNRDVLLKLLG